MNVHGTPNHPGPGPIPVSVDQPAGARVVNQSYEQLVNDGTVAAAHWLTSTMANQSRPSDKYPDAAANDRAATNSGDATGRPKAARLPTATAAAIGLLAGAAALAAGEVAGAIGAPRPGPVTAVSNRVVDKAPIWFVNFGKSLFGLADKPALLLGTTIISLLLAIGFGLASRRSPTVGVLGIFAFGLVGLLSTTADAQAGLVSAIVINTIAVASGVCVLLILFSLGVRANSRQTVPTQSSNTAPLGTASGLVLDSPTDPAVARRSFLGFGAVVGVGSALGGLSAKTLRNRSSVNEARNAVQIVAPEQATTINQQVVQATAGDVATTAGITPVIVPGDKFYRIDTALLVPQVDPANWKLTIKGLVDQELTFTYDQLLERATTVETVTLSCVSNEIGGDLVGNAVWQGIPLIELLDEAGVQPGATQISSKSVDGWDCGFPTEAAYDGRTAMVALAMNGEPLPIKHGFPARLVVSGLYGYVSATKWLSEIELTTFEDFDGYWINRGWSKSGPVKTQSRIDTPRNRSKVQPGEPVAIAGVAWAPNTGITKVEVQVDEDPWIEATLGDSLGVNAWRQWLVSWTPTKGDHQIRVRATDETGVTQTEERTRVAPNGASGWHTISVKG